jgi:hypothetical protein
MTMVELLQPRTIISRINGRDIRLLVDHPYVYFRREDVEDFADIPPWGNGETLLLDDDQVIEVNGVEYYTLETVLYRARFDALSSEKGDELLRWIDAELDQYLTPEVLEAAHRAPSFAEAYTVAAAAKLLDQDPGVSMGRDRLFEFMSQLGWIERNTTGADAWIPTRLPTSRDWVAIRTVNVGPRKSPTRYLQIHITNAGLAELRRALAATARPSARPVAPTLFDGWADVDS